MHTSASLRSPDGGSYGRIGLRLYVTWYVLDQVRDSVFEESVNHFGLDVSQQGM